MRVLTKECYEQKARKVIVHYSDQVVDNMRYDYQTDEDILDIHKWQTDKILDYLQPNCCYISVYLDDEAKPTTRVDIRQKFSKKWNELMKQFYSRSMNSEIRWCLLSLPTDAWAQQVFGSHPDSF